LYHFEFCIITIAKVPHRIMPGNIFTQNLT